MAHASTATVSMALLGGILQSAAEAGIDCTPILHELALTPSQLATSDLRLPRTNVYRLWELLADAEPDPGLGLRISEHSRPGHYAVLDYAMRNSPTLGAAYQRLTEYMHVLHDGLSVACDVVDTDARIFYNETAKAQPRGTEWGVAMWLQIGRQITGRAWVPSSVSFEHTAPDDLSEHHRVFQCPLSFDAPRNELCFPQDLLKAPVVGADPNLLAVVSTYAREQLDRVKRFDSISDRVSQVITELLAGGEVNVERASVRLGMSPRTLQRKLRADGSSFQALLDDVRCGLAKRYLGDKSITIEETAFLLGFSEISAFHRAFKTWTGTTPREFREAAIS